MLGIAIDTLKFLTQKLNEDCQFKFKKKQSPIDKFIYISSSCNYLTKINANASVPF